MIKKTYEQVQQEIAQFLLTKEYLVVHCRRIVDVQAQAEGNTSAYSWHVFSTSFTVSHENGGEDCSIDVDRTWHHRGDEQDKSLDERGDLYTRYALEVKVNYPCYGGSPPAEVVPRLELCTAVNDFALEIEQKFCSSDVEVWILTQTKEDRDAIAARSATVKLNCAVRDVVVKNCKNMRVGAERDITSNPDAIPAGEYTQVLNGKTYELGVFERPTLDGVVMVLYRMQ